MIKICIGNRPTSATINPAEVTIEEFVALFQPSRLECTMAEYHSLPQDSRNRLKAGRYVTPCMFKGAARNAADATTVSLVCLDIDHSADAIRLYKDPDWIGCALDGWQWLAHSTATSTPDCPRLRIFVVAAGWPAHPVSYYQAAVSLISSRLGVVADSASRVICQPMYLPRLPKDAPAWLYYDMAGQALRRDMIPAMPLATKVETGKAATEVGGTGGIDAFSHLVGPADLPDSTIRDALAAISPDCTRDQWIRVCCALKHQYQGSEDGWKLFDGWSSLSASKYDAAKCRQQWDYEDANPADRNPVTIHTLLHMAAEAGFSPPETTETSGERSQVDRLCDSCPEIRPFIEAVQAESDLVKLSTEYPRQIGRMTLPATARAVLLDFLKVRIVKLTGRKVSQKELSQQANIARHSGATERAREKHPWANGWVYVQHSEDFISPTGEKISEDALDSTYGTYLLADEEYFSPKGRPTVRASDFLCNVIDCPKVKNALYRPDQPPRSLYTDVDGTYYNLYRPSHPEAVYDAAAEKIVLDHVKWLLPDHYQILMDFMAYVVQNPGQRINWAILLKGPYGCGKTFFSQLMQKVIGSDHVDILNASAVKGNTTSWAEGHQMTFIEEIRIAGSNRFEIMDALKPFITNDMIQIRKLYHDPYQVKNIANYVMFSNHEDALAITDNDRRYCILRSDVLDCEVAAKNTAGYFKTLFSVLYSNPGACRHLFENWKISADFAPKGHAPKTQAKAFMSYMAQNDTVVATKEIMEEGKHPLIQRDLLSSGALLNVLKLEHEVRVGGMGLAHNLIEMGYRREPGRIQLGTTYHSIWCHNTFTGNAVEEIKKRYQGEIF